MHTRFSFLLRTIPITALLLILLAVPASAGGWATITLDTVPGSAQVGEPLQIGFTTRGHGVTRVDWDGFALVATNPETGESIRATSRREGATGHYVAELEFPSAGTWEWGGAHGDQRVVNFQPLSVVPAASASAQTGITIPAGSSLPLLILTLAMAGLGGLLVLWLRNGQRYGLVAVIAAGLIVVIGIGAALSTSQDAASAQVESTNVEQGHYGEALFMAKGCATCHIRSGIDQPFVTQVGPNLSEYKSSPEFLRLWLADPASIRPNTKMPNLELSQDEIEALIAFLVG
ncbi:MAG: c-type cytochrome [Caldilineales bacterium]|nr:c-type cytochrome [Caldilineales bacterium]